MKVLLCTPWGTDAQTTTGGITVWGHNIVDYHLSQASDVEIEVVPFDRKIRGAGGLLLKSVARAWYGVVDYWKPICTLRSKLKRRGCNVVHLCTSGHISLVKDIVVLRLAKRYGAKGIVHFHYGRISGLANQDNWEWRLIKRAVRLADMALAIDMKSFTALRQQGFNNIRYLPNPLSQGVIGYINQCSEVVKRKATRLCFVGHVIPTKGVFELVEACSKIPEIELHVVGSVASDIRKEMERLAEGGDWLVFVGEVDRNRVVQEMLSAGIFVLPTYTEGFPNVIIESMACGCAIVTTPVGAIPEMLNIESDAPCGLCCEPREVDGLRQHIQYFIDHPESARQYAFRAKERVNEMYAIPEVWGQLVQIYGKISDCFSDR